MNKLPKAKWWLLLTILFLGGITLLMKHYLARREHSQDGAILAAATKYGVDRALVKAVIWRESWFNPGARGRKGEIGLMQIRAEAASDWARAEHLLLFQPEQLFDPGTNTLAGTWYLRKLLGRYQQTDNPLPYALADYNAGRTHVLQWAKGSSATNSAAFMEEIGFPSTREYVRAIMKRREHYGSQ